MRMFKETKSVKEQLKVLNKNYSLEIIRHLKIWLTEVKSLIM